jgi:hypothetical protein
MKSLRIYTYKVTFEEAPYWYWGVHKEKKFGEVYLGSPVTHKWMWDFYTPAIQLLEFFPYTDEGWAEALRLEKRLISPDLNNPLCLNEGCAGVYSLDALRKSGAKVAAMLLQEKDERGKPKHYVAMGKASAAKPENIERNRLRGAESVKHMNEVVHSEKNEEGKSLHALRLNENLHQLKDENGKSLHTLKLHKRKDKKGKSLHAKEMAAARWGGHGKSLSVTFPNGSTKIFDSLTSASESLCCDISQLSKWARKSHTPRKGKLAGHIICYVHQDQGKTT